jgi:hypothetical protein
MGHHQPVAPIVTDGMKVSGRPEDLAVPAVANGVALLATVRAGFITGEALD